MKYYSARRSELYIIDESQKHWVEQQKEDIHKRIPYCVMNPSLKGKINP